MYQCCLFHPYAIALGDTVTLDSSYVVKELAIIIIINLFYQEPGNH